MLMAVGMLSSYHPALTYLMASCSPPSTPLLTLNVTVPNVNNGIS